MRPVRRSSTRMSSPVVQLPLAQTAKNPPVDLPVSAQVVQGLLVRQSQRGVKTEQACLPHGPIIQQHAIMLGIDKAADIHLPGVLHEGEWLHMPQAEIPV